LFLPKLYGELISGKLLHPGNNAENKESSKAFLRGSFDCLDITKVNTIIKIILIISKLTVKISLSFRFGAAGDILKQNFIESMPEKDTYRSWESFPPPEDEITMRDMLILALQIQNEMKKTKKLAQSINEGKTTPSSTANKNPKPKQNGGPLMNHKIMNSDWLSTEDVMKWLRKSKRTIQNYRNEGKIPFETFNGCIYYSKREIEKHFKKHEVKSCNKR